MRCYVGLMPLVTLHCDQVPVSMKAYVVAHLNLFSAFWMSFAHSPLPASSGTICGIYPQAAHSKLSLLKWLPVNPICCWEGWAVICDSAQSKPGTGDPFQQLAFLSPNQQTILNLGNFVRHPLPKPSGTPSERDEVARLGHQGGCISGLSPCPSPPLFSLLQRNKQNWQSSLFV